MSQTNGVFFIPEGGGNVDGPLSNNHMDSEASSNASSMTMDPIYQNNSLNYGPMDNYNLMYNPQFDPSQMQGNPIQMYNMSPHFLFNNNQVTSSTSSVTSIRQTYPGPHSHPHVQFAIPYQPQPQQFPPNIPTSMNSANSLSPKTANRKGRTLAQNRAISAPNMTSHLNSLDYPSTPKSPDSSSLSPDNSQDGMVLSTSNDNLSGLLNSEPNNSRAVLKTSGDKHRGRNQQNNESNSSPRGKPAGNRTAQEMFLWEKMKTPQLQKLSTLFKNADQSNQNVPMNHPAFMNRRDLMDRPSKLRKTASEETVIDYDNYMSNAHHAHLTSSLSAPGAIGGDSSRPDRRLHHSQSFNLHDLKEEDDWESSSDSLALNPDMYDIKMDNPNNKLGLKEQPNFLQRKCYANENRYLLPNPMVIALREGSPKIGGYSVKEGYVTVSLVDNQGNRITDPNVARLESTTGSLVKKFEADGTASLSLKLHCYNTQNRFRLMFDCEYQLQDDSPPIKELIVSDPFQVHSNKSIASRCPKMWDILPKEGSASKSHEVWIKGKDYHLKGMVIHFDGKEANIIEITPTLVSVKIPARPDLKETKTVEVKIWNAFHNKLVASQEFQSFTYLA